MELVLGVLLDRHPGSFIRVKAALKDDASISHL